MTMMMSKSYYNIVLIPYAASFSWTVFWFAMLGRGYGGGDRKTGWEYLEGFSRYQIFESH